MQLSYVFLASLATTASTVLAAQVSGLEAISILEAYLFATNSAQLEVPSVTIAVGVAMMDTRLASVKRGGRISARVIRPTFAPTSSVLMEKRKCPRLV